MDNLVRSFNIQRHSRQEVALKLEHVWIDRSYLANEIEIYEELAGG